MRALILADLQLDIWLKKRRDPLGALDPRLWPTLNAVIVSGALSPKPRTTWPHIIAHLAQYIDPARIHICPGNGDYHDHTLDGDDRLAEICAEAGAALAQKREIVIGRTRFLCCTLWTDFALHGDPARAMLIAGRDLNDYRRIRYREMFDRRIRPVDTALVHAEHRRWLEERLAEGFLGKTIVVTRHCPHPGLVGEHWLDVDPAYCSDLLAMIERFQPNAWFFGHKHHPAATWIGRTFLSNVALGGPRQVAPGEEAAVLLRGFIDDRLP